jgi:hypothetical protein
MDRRYNLFSDIIYTKKLVYSKNYNNDNYNIKNFSIMTWNLWGTPCYKKLSLLNERFDFIIKKITNFNCDIMCFQEVSQYLLDKLLIDTNLKNYHFSHSKINNNYSNTTLIISKYKFNEIKVYHLKAEHDCSVTVAKIGNIYILNCYLQSGGYFSNLKIGNIRKYHQYRMLQLDDIYNIINDLKSDNVFLMGDFNFNLDGTKKDWPEINTFNNYKKIFDDSFLKSGKKYGLTEDTEINTMRYNIKKYHKCFRYDGILYKSKNFNLSKFNIIGKEPIFDISNEKFHDLYKHHPIKLNENNKVDWFISDHFGLASNYILK